MFEMFKCTIFCNNSLRALAIWICITTKTTMIILLFILFGRVSTIVGTSPSALGATTPLLAHIDALPNVGKYGDAQHRGPDWYKDASSSSSASDMDTTETETDSTTSSDEFSPSESSSASSFETKEEKLATRVYRVCTPCPHDMMKKHKNIGIKWICGGYQRARRSFKSECMMRYRNCEDGTMFVKLYDHRCKPDPYHGRSWFYIYRT